MSETLRPIYVYVDRFESSNDSLNEKNRRVIQQCYRYAELGLIADFRIAEKNLKTKKALHNGIEFVFESKEYCIYVEDDLKIIGNPFSTLDNVEDKVAKESLITFFPPYGHKENKVLYTDWPSMWGVGFSRSLYNSIYDNLKIPSYEEIATTVEMKFKSLLYSRGIDKGRFVEIWSHKFERAFKSETAWDTEMHYLLWEQDILTLQTAQKVFLDSGVDQSSLNKSRDANLRFNRYHKPSQILIRKSGLNLDSCVTCEKQRYFSNGLYSNWYKTIKSIPASLFSNRH